MELSLVTTTHVALTERDQLLVLIVVQSCFLLLAETAYLHTTLLDSHLFPYNQRAKHNANCTQHYNWTHEMINKQKEQKAQQVNGYGCYEKGDHSGYHLLHVFNSNQPYLVAELVLSSGLILLDRCNIWITQHQILGVDNKLCTRYLKRYALVGLVGR